MGSILTQARVERSAAPWIGVVIGVALTVLAGCASGSAKGAIPIEQYPDDPATAARGEYVIGVGDSISIQVFDQAQMSGRMKVRSDGRISLPFVNDIEAAGKTPPQLAGELENALKAVVISPRVTVVVEDSSPLRISILGEVRMPGLHDLQRGAGVAQALASAGGLTNFAHKDRIFVSRNAPKPVRLHFTYDQLTKAVGRAASFQLRPGDVVVVE
jgi:polysaccharide export outer membrane protein